MSGRQGDRESRERSDPHLMKENNGLAAKRCGAGRKANQGI
jgi:hypothetical protein